MTSKKIGVLWIPKNKNINQPDFHGKLDLGVLGEKDIAIFVNTRKVEGSNQPDFNIVLSEPKPQTQ